VFCFFSKPQEEIDTILNAHREIIADEFERQQRNNKERELRKQYVINDIKCFMSFVCERLDTFGELQTQNYVSRASNQEETL
jgi:hypothetical protein